ncbi:MAG: hypothetical protein NTW22_07540, partial [Proteobacteria bacterium]|nr:hypothetical protein [Pseudomonadota bacterium]
MPLKIRILLWVSSLFLLSISCVFIVSYLEINQNLKKEENKLIDKIKQVDEKNIANIISFLSISLNNDAEKMYHVFEFMRSSAQWRLKFVPDPYNVRTKSWGSSAAALATFPWLDLISVDINNELGAFIHQSSPYLRKYVKVPINPDLTLFTTKTQDGCLCAYVGVPFWTNQVIPKYVDDKDFPDFFLAKGADQWLLYEIEQLLEMDPSSFVQQDTGITEHLFDEAITMHTKEEVNFFINSLKKMIEVTKTNLLKYPDLISSLKDPKLRDRYMKKKIEDIHPNLLLERNFCVGPLCNFSKQRPEPKWATRTDFEHKLIQKDMIWELCMLLRTGIWGFTPFAKNSPKGVVTALEPTTNLDPSFFNNVVEGFFSTDAFIDHPIKIEKECELKSQNPEYDRKVLFDGDKQGLAQSCYNSSLKIIFSPELQEPFLSFTNYITYQKPTMKEPNIAAITFGIALDPIFINLALVSPDDVALVAG